ncbi:MAG: M20 family metallopeptidase [Thalassobaculales bacterium]
MTDPDLIAAARRVAPGLVAIRRTIHANPELAFQEVKTAALVTAQLRSLGIETRTGVGRTGVIGVLRGGRPGRTIGVRADMDALPVTEATGLDFASQVPGAMHACGHDVHTVIALGVAELLAERRDSLPGTVKFLFQPAEETLEGAPAMIADGALEDPAMDAIIGFHNWPALDADMVGYVPDVVLASSDAFDITLKGRAGHAAHPHTAIDAIVGAGHVVTLLQTIISREVAPVVPAVVTIGQIQGGTARNVIAGEVVLKGGVRALDAEASSQVEAAMRRILDGACASLRLDYTLHYERKTPVLRNRPDILATSLEAVRRALGTDKVVQLPAPSMGSEDFAWFAERVPAAHLRIGGRVNGGGALHMATFQCNEQAIPTGVVAVTAATLALLEE